MYSTADGGVAALVYGPSELKTKLPDGTALRVTEQTNYPFEDQILFKVSINRPAEFPLHLRVPAWCKQAELKINGVVANAEADHGIIKIKRKWKSGDQVILTLPMHLSKSKWYENSVSIERGPLTFALKMKEDLKEVNNTKDPEVYGKSYTEVHPQSPWNYGLYDMTEEKLDENFKVEFTGKTSNYPWNLENVPLQIKTKAKRIPFWTIYQGMAGPLPYSHIYGLEKDDNEEEITLVPYGCTTLRISQFPQVGRK